jgi:rhomboid family GlyGly-CTERM serine protease
MVANPANRTPNTEHQFSMLQRLFQSYRVTILVSLVAIAAWAIPSLSQWLELDYLLLAEGQWWRIWTGHLTHYGTNHLFWDLLMFAVLGAACERQHPHRFAIGLIVMMAGVAGLIGLRCDEVLTYRGLSGIDTGLFVWLVVAQCRRCWIARDRLIALVWLSAIIGLIGKLIYEAATGQALFVDASNFTPLVEAHLAGAFLGLLCGCFRIPGQQQAAMAIHPS